jgi:hypothetical protein
MSVRAIPVTSTYGGGGWEFERLGGDREWEMNLFVYWDIKKFYKKLDN